MKKNDFVKESDVIVIGKLVKVTSKNVDQLHDQVARFQVSKKIVGKISHSFNVLGSKKGICAPLVDFSQAQEGTYLLFLKNEGFYYRDVNGDYSVLEIRNGLVKWYKDDQSLEMVDTPLEKVLQEVRSLSLGNNHDE